MTSNVESAMGTTYWQVTQPDANLNSCEHYRQFTVNTKNWTFFGHLHRVINQSVKCCQALALTVSLAHVSREISF